VCCWPAAAGRHSTRLQPLAAPRDAGAAAIQVRLEALLTLERDRQARHDDGRDVDR
jgi:hypothetical protein